MGLWGFDSDGLKIQPFSQIPSRCNKYIESKHRYVLYYQYSDILKKQSFPKKPSRCNKYIKSKHTDMYNTISIHTA
ncbi:hypothetical protein Leryth_010363 [Lithospermum erythrorhizon]|nr:hypothetical protein Leryth_010363 [Lithospermum erythrorhizon]